MSPRPGPFGDLGRLFPLAALIALSLAGAAEEARAQGGEPPRRDQEVLDDEIVDHGWLFTLKRPARSWQLIAEAEARRISPGALAAATSDHGIWMVVIVDQITATEPEAFARTLLEQMTVEDKSVEQFEPATIGGLPGVRFALSGKAGGVPVTFACSLVLREGHAYRLLRWTADPRLVDELGDLEGQLVVNSPDAPVPGRDPVLEDHDRLGVGWRVEGSVFESAAFGIRIEQSGWRLIAGPELAQMLPDAEVGLAFETPEAYITVMAERASGVERAGYEEGLRAGRAEGLGGAPIEEIEADVAGRKTMLALFQADVGLGEPYDYVHAVVWHGDVVVQVLGWWRSAVRKEAMPSALEQLGRIELLEEAKRAEIEAALLAADDPQDAVGAEHAIRGGSYRDYVHDLTWNAPATGFWRLSGGQQARARNPAASLFIQEPRRGLLGMVIAERVPGLSPEQLHAHALQGMLPPEHPAHEAEPRLVVDGETERRSSWVDVDVEGLALRYLVATFARGDRRVQFLIWGMPGNVAASRKVAEEMAAGLELSGEDLLPTEAEPRRVRDDRLGFELSIPDEAPGWTMRVSTPAPIQATGSVIEGRLDPTRGFVLLVVCTEAPNQQAFDAIINKMLIGNFRRRLGVVPAGDPKPAEVGGLAGTHQRLVTPDAPGGAVDVFVTRRDNTLFGLLVFDEKGTGPDAKAVASWLKILDWKRDGSEKRFY